MRWGRDSAAVVLVVTASLLACRSTDTAPAERRSAAAEIGQPRAADVAVRLFVTAETRGFLGPCGCEEKQQGGFPRRATYLASVAGGGDLRIDLGNLAPGKGALKDLRLRATLDALERTNYDVLVPGRYEVELGEQFRVEAAAHSSVHVVCANLVDGAGAPVFPPTYLHTLADGRRIAIIGVTDDLTGAPAELRVLPAAASVKLAAESVADADAIVIAAAMPHARAREVARSVPGATLVLASATTDDDLMMMGSAKADPAGEGFRGSAPPLVTAGAFAAYVRRVDLDHRLAPSAAWRAWLGEEVADDAELAALVKPFRQDAIALDPDLVPDIWKGLTARGFAGSHACAPCHEDSHTTWAASLHGRAMRILVERDANRDPECVPCHLVDIPADGSRDIAQADALGVGCEGCHGGRAEHIALAQDSRLPENPPDDRASDGCRGCHHPPEVKSFDFDVQWPRIAHSR